ncbi:MAG TPA: hypothetical protein VL125_08745 [Pelobium sp.]|nr:hypothetical protein [Pelobium sp.]
MKNGELPIYESGLDILFIEISGRNAYGNPDEITIIQFAEEVINLTV